MKTFEHDDYRTLLRTALLEKKEQFGGRWTFQSMARAARVQKAYLSRVLAGDGHLNEDQVYASCRFLEFSDDEREFALLLLGIQRSVIDERRRELKARLERLRTELGRTERHVAVDAASTGSLKGVEGYFLDPLNQLVHMFLTIDRYANNTKPIAAELGISRDKLAKILAGLVQTGVIEWTGSRYKVLRDRLHLPVDSPVYEIYRTLMRMAALDRTSRLPASKTHNFSVLFSADEAVRKKIHGLFLKFLGEVGPMVTEARAAEVYQINFDLLRWSGGPDAD